MAVKSGVIITIFSASCFYDPIFSLFSSCVFKILA